MSKPGSARRLVIAGAILLMALPACSSKSPPEPKPYEASPSDGGGSATVTPDDPVRIGETGTWRIDYEVGPLGIAEGGGIALHISPYWGWTAPQTQSPGAAGYVSAVVDGSAASLELTANRQLHWVSAVVTGDRLPPGSRVSFVYGDVTSAETRAPNTRVDRFAESDEEFWIKVDGDGDGYYTSIATQPTIDILPGPARRLLVFGPSMARVGDTIELAVSVVDGQINRATDYTGTVLLQSLEAGLEHPETIEFTAADRGAKTVRARVVTPGVARVLVTDPQDRLALSVSNPVVAMDALPQYRLFWADLQIHTGQSDGTGTPEEVYRYAREVARLDVAALTDHDAHGIVAIDETPAIWERLTAATRNAHEPGRFVTLLGYEWTSWTFGHKHILYRDDTGPLWSHRDEESKTPDGLWKALPAGRAMTISHHTLGEPVVVDWDYHDPEVERLVEICSIHGNSEGVGQPMAVRGAKEGHGVRDALARGYRLGFVGSGDTHNGHPGLGDPTSAPTGGIAGIYATDLTREAIWDALYHRRTYASTGPRVVLDVTLNETMMGGVVTLGSVDTERTLSIEAHAPFKIRTLDIIKNERLYVSTAIDDLRFALAFDDPEPAADGDRYYVRLRLQNDQMVFSSPIWVELPE